MRYSQVSRDIPRRLRTTELGRGLYALLAQLRDRGQGSTDGREDAQGEVACRMTCCTQGRGSGLGNRPASTGMQWSECLEQAAIHTCTQFLYAGRGIRCRPVGSLPADCEDGRCGS